MSEPNIRSEHSEVSGPSEVQELFDQLVGLVGPAEGESLLRAGTDPVVPEKFVTAIKQIAEIPIVQTEGGAAVQFVLKKHVFNVRPLVWPTLVLIVEKVAVAIAPGLESALLPFIDLAAYAETAGEIYRRLTDDEVDVFGAVCDLNRTSAFAPSVVDRNAHPTPDGVMAYLVSKKFELSEPITLNYIQGLLDSLVKKGGLIKIEGKLDVTLYEPTFLGKKGE